MVKYERDANMIVETRINRPGIRFYDIEEEPIRLYGLFREGDFLARLPMEVADVTVGKAHPGTRSNNAGGRVRFITNSPYVAVHLKIDDPYVYASMPVTGSLGLDCYVGDAYAGTFVPPVRIEDNIIESVVNLGAVEERMITVNLPQYTNIEKMYIGIDGDCKISRAPDYRIEKPVVFYGSSITNGACASRPGMSYENQLSRALDFNYINLGFGGCAKGESEMAEYIASLDMSAFVYDYDHNAPTPAYLEATHEPFFKIIRAKHPTLPVIMISRPAGRVTPEVIRRFEIIKATYENAVRAGDKNVYLVNGAQFFPEEIRLDCTSDNTHPTDLGFYYMAKAIKPHLREALGFKL